MQVNHSPSFHTDAPLDKEVKEGLLHDTFVLLNLNANEKRRCIEEDRKRVKERLLYRHKPKDMMCVTIYKSPHSIVSHSVGKKMNSQWLNMRKS